MPAEPAAAATPLVREPRPLSGRFVLLCLIAFFGVIFAVNATMMTIAIRTMPGLDVKNGYVASQAMNGEISTMRQQIERNWTADVAAEMRNGTSSVDFRLMEKDRTPVTGLDISVRLAHPAITRSDRTAVMEEIGPGHYRAEWPDVSAGAWTVVIEASRGGERVYATRNRVVLGQARR